ncbi:MAG: hypothetical protein HOH43_10595 [Candidatus Latescibacteria bacterium]|nr:hypothetical protein [Candidatus Latescibacterota bacterium]
MSDGRPEVVVLCQRNIREQYMQDEALSCLESFAQWRWIDCQDGHLTEDGDLIAQIKSANAVVLAPGAPQISGDIMDRVSGLGFIGDMEGDRFAQRIDLDAAWERGIRTIDTTNGSSYPVSEWALALIIISLRNAGAHFRNMIAGRTRKTGDDPGYKHGDLYGKRIGLIGCGHIGRRLIKFLEPFRCEIFVYDPYLPREMADAVGFTQTSLKNVMSGTDAIVCLAPITRRTRGMIGKEELDWIPEGAIFVNVSRGAVVDSVALIARLERGDIVAGLDVFDPEPVPEDSEILNMPNVFLSPHIAGVTEASYPRMFTLMVDELQRHFSGHETLFDLTPGSSANRRGLDT